MEHGFVDERPGVRGVRAVRPGAHEARSSRRSGRSCSQAGHDHVRDLDPATLYTNEFIDDSIIDGVTPMTHLRSARAAAVAEIAAGSAPAPCPPTRRCCSRSPRTGRGCRRCCRRRCRAGRYLADAVVRPTQPRAGRRGAAGGLRARRAGHAARGRAPATTARRPRSTAGSCSTCAAWTRSTVNAGGTITRRARAPGSPRSTRSARAAGRDIWMYPSTKSSTVGGFIGGGSAGTGTIEHGTTSDGFVVSALRWRRWTAAARLRRVTGDELTPYIHTYGVTGILVDVEIRTDPARDWVAVYAALRHCTPTGGRAPLRCSTCRCCRGWPRPTSRRWCRR